MQILSTLGNWALLALVFLAMISVLVAAHELGHYLFARLFGMGVKEFAIGFGKKPIWTWMRRNYTVRDSSTGVETIETTNFTVRPWPVGGFVQIEGMMPEDDGSEVRIPGGFYSKSPLQRLIVLLAGPAFSVLAGILLLVPLYMTVGIRRPNNVPVVPYVKADGPAAHAGMKVGDRIESIDGQPVTSFYQILVAVHAKPGQPMTFVVDRQGKEIPLSVTPEMNKVDSLVLDSTLSPTGEWKRQPMVGIGIPMDQHFEVLGFRDSMVTAVNLPVMAVRSMASLFLRPKNFENTVSGPVSMVAATDYAIKQGLATLINLGALLSISVGIFNLLPFGPLDGGQMLVALIELVRGGRRLSIQVQSAINGVGLALISLLVLSACFFDFKHLFTSDDATPAKPATTQSK